MGLLCGLEDFSRGLLHQASGAGSRGQPEAGQEAAGLTGEQVKLQVKIILFSKAQCVVRFFGYFT